MMNFSIIMDRWEIGTCKEFRVAQESRRVGKERKKDTADVQRKLKYARAKEPKELLRERMRRGG